ncbi:hypothetical protein PJ985_00260 [Streptomyces sp. ACA25]|uniref:hypothetical protein n=1 Tax=Streptomyces sp. ACA25 TaxID=3022596 RepID=UPI0023075331|nr:hypothetical protein [Streptomyces sp. ACA25]MDB1086015.1 hypothetical protein [Streptomyces sp. ACA25]
MGQQRAAHSARDHALAVLRVRNAAVATALLPTAAAVLLLAGGATGHLPSGWTPLRVAVLSLAVVSLVLAAATALVIVRARPEDTPTIDLPERAAPALHGLIRDLAARLDVPAPTGLALTPDCDSWLEERSGRPGSAAGPVLVIGSPFLWWMRVGELRALLAPVVAGTGPSAHPDIAAARRSVRNLDATAALEGDTAALRHPVRALAGRLARVLLRHAGPHATRMERGVAAAASARARAVDYGTRVVAQEQVGLAYAGWDRLLTRVALPAWRAGRWPRRLNAGVVAALTELSRRDRLAESFTSRLGERPACDLLEEPGAVDEEISRLAARLFHGSPARGSDWEPVDWPAYPQEVVDRIWRERAARLFSALDATGHPTLSRVLQLLGEAAAEGGTDSLAARVEAAHARSGAVPVSPFTTPPLAFPLQPARSGRDLLVEHIAAAVCCATADATAAAPGLDWLDGPVLVTDGERCKDLTAPVSSLVEDGDGRPLRNWLADAGVPPDKLVRLV